MMKNIAQSIILTITASLSVASVFAQSYYPIEIGKSWTYDVTEFATSDTNRTNYKVMLSGTHNREEWSKQKAKIVIETDSVVNGKTYRVVANANGTKMELVREENGNYFRFNNTTFKDDNFLKANLETGNIWLDYSNPEQTAATIYKVTTVAKQLTVKGKTYKNVMAISEFTGSMEQIYSLLKQKTTFPITKYYAQNIGLIYNYIPYPMGETYSDIEISLAND